MNQIFTYYMQLPHTIKGVVVPGDGDYTIYINNLYNQEQCQEALNHELRHILLCHFEDGRDVQELEAEADDAELLLREIRQAEVCGLPMCRCAPHAGTAAGTAQSRGAGRRKGRSVWAPRPPRETEQEAKHRLLAFMKESTQPKYKREYAWVKKLEQELEQS